MNLIASGQASVANDGLAPSVTENRRPDLAVSRLFQQIEHPKLHTQHEFEDHGSMTSDREIEFKFHLQTEADFERLQRALHPAPCAPVALQVNHFFDTADGELQRRGLTLRLREEGGGFVLTAKGPKLKSDAAGTWSARNEVETEVDADTARRCLAGEASPLACLRAACPAPLLDAMSSALNDAELCYIGNFENERTRIGPVALQAENGTQSVRYEFDRTRFPGDDIQYEVEVEVSSEGDAELLHDALVSVLKEARVTWTSAPAKAQRFFEALNP